MERKRTMEEEGEIVVKTRNKEMLMEKNRMMDREIDRDGEDDKGRQGEGD